MLNAFIKPKNKLAKRIFSGFHWPNIITAKAKKPYPLTCPEKVTELETTKTNPPIPARAPEMMVPNHRIR